MRILPLFFLLGLANLFLRATNIDGVENWPSDPLITRALTAEDEDNFLTTRPIVISLGDSCQPALNLMYAKLRFMAYPFDWIVAPFDDVYDMIKTDFMYCNQREYFVEAYDSKINNLRATNIHYPQLLFPHAKWESLFEDFNRRIKRFYKAIYYSETSKKKVFFVIHSLTFRNDSVKAMADKLRDLLSQKFPNLDFTLIVMHHADILNNSTDANCIFTYLKHEGWTQESYSEWRDKFTAMGLINPHAATDSFSGHPF